MRTAEADRLRAQVDRLKQQNAELRREVGEARREMKRQAAPFRRRERVSDPKRPGRKKGHPPSNRAPPAEVDRDVNVPLCACPDCGGTDITDVKKLAPQIVVDIPPKIRPEAVRYHNESGHCGGCRRRVRSKHPDQHSTAIGAAGVQLGPRLLALSVDLRHRVGTPYRKLVEIFLLVFGLKVSAGALVRAHQRIAGRCLPTYHALTDAVRRAAVVHVDETGWHIANSTATSWLWVFATVTPRITVYAIRFSRGKDVVTEILGSAFAGILAVDGWAAYIGVPCRKGQCGAHLLRRCSELIDKAKGNAVSFPRQVRDLLRTAILLKASVGLLAPRRYRWFRDKLVDVFERLLQCRLTDPDNERLRKHLANHADEVLLHLDVPELPPTNNFGEQEVRPAVLTRKISAGNRTPTGAFTHAVLATMSRTAKRNDVVLTFTLPALLCSRDHAALLPLTDDLVTPSG